MESVVGSLLASAESAWWSEMALTARLAWLSGLGLALSPLRVLSECMP